MNCDFLGNNEHSHIVVAVVQGTLPEPEASGSYTNSLFHMSPKRRSADTDERASVAPPGDH